MHAETICGMNVLAVRDALRRAKALCLKGEEPVLIEAETYRHWGHNFVRPRRHVPGALLENPAGLVA